MPASLSSLDYCLLLGIPRDHRNTPAVRVGDADDKGCTMFCSDCLAGHVEVAAIPNLDKVPAAVTVYRSKALCLACVRGYLDDANHDDPTVLYDEESNQSSRTTSDADTSVRYS